MDVGSRKGSDLLLAGRVSFNFLGAGRGKGGVLGSGRRNINFKGRCVEVL